ncbi:class I SAM-dependent methyltransferase [Candidatus Sororendozoicomonas aggregata]|uniref:class I SAM-dependent methyltransferase n=1 Tax=Candidatus Sororendozoicomonas aggregata TaxID=3073239 RepID=UPI002ED5EECA
MDNLFLNTAKYYDLGMDTAHVNRDVEFFLSRFNDHDSILDIGCGTGRLTFAFQDADHPTDGLDLSSSMRKVFLHKAEQANFKGKHHFTDMRDMKIYSYYDHIVIGFRTLQGIDGYDDIVRSLKSMANHLNNEGSIWITWLNPKCDTDFKKYETGISDYQESSNDFSLVRTYHYLKDTGITTKIFQVTYDINCTKKGKKKVTDKIQMNYMGMPGLLDCISSSGLNIRNIYKDYSNKPYGISVLDCKLTRDFIIQCGV